MPFAIEVKLPKEQQAEFPEECVGCGAAAPGRLVTIRDWGWILSRKTVVPACGPCGWRLRWWRLGRRIGLSLLYLVGGWVAFRGLKGQSSVVRLLATFGAGLLAAMPLYVWETVRPPAISVDIGGEMITYRFRDPMYAAMFTALNGGSVE